MAKKSGARKKTKKTAHAKKAARSKGRPARSEAVDSYGFLCAAHYEGSDSEGSEADWMDEELQSSKPESATDDDADQPASRSDKRGRKRCPHVKQTCNETHSDDELDKLWLCRMCMKCFCGSERHGHDGEHARAYQHPLMIRLSNGDCWCFECKCMLPMDDARMRNVREWSVLTRKRVDELVARSDAAKSKAKLESQSMGAAKRRSLGVHGLRNLGNTCFFNASMQALSVTRPLRMALESHSPAGMHDQRSPLVAAFVGLLDKMQDGASDTIVPAELHTIICKRWKQFKGFRQQDAHELLRCLLDGLREDERKCSYAYEDALDIAVPINGHSEQLEGKKRGSKSIHRQKREARRKQQHQEAEESEEDEEEEHATATEADVAEIQEAMGSIALKDDAPSNEDIEQHDDMSDDETSIGQEAACIPPVSLEQQQLTEQLFKDHSGMLAGKKQLSITSCLAAFTRTERLANDNQFACEACWKLLNPHTASDDDKDDAEPAQSADDACASDDSETSEMVDALGNTIPASSSSSSSTTATSRPASKPRYVMRNARKRFLICHPAPRVLMIQLKRFEQTARGRTRKIERHVDLDAELELSPFMAPPTTDGEAKDARGTRYRLVAVVEQMGGLVGGHYVAYIRRAEQPDNEHATHHHAWIYCSDGQIRPSSWDEVSRSQAYIAFYECIE
ncbi:hypothetical protein SYNPS1DRAFT_29744 [Syncephalis pseudoplumigaleata]|uniref:Uncharacterized protein n=1 Tax=Syncephalis pseudoplumigaleata TaxID=1712513 RepID=A0A4P9YYP9_9FUNG|nr:hypothetical protein SYNPS1DRAFT_29744 [Syncephalis pseudoplumigaleata]|eukprot:RKP24491.1 hypothetical protein SYNPS1DRAFT_29744 [Syncephalis pseudoplumigaleata]